MQTTKEYRSPLPKLVRFFERSRDGWKEKCRTLKQLTRRQDNRVRSLERSRNHWKVRARQLQAELRQLKRMMRPQQS